MTRPGRPPAPGGVDPGGGLALGPGLVLPVEAVTETFAVLAKRGAGKTYTAAVLVEEMLGAGCRWWWSTRSGCGGGCARARTAPGTAYRW